MSKDTLAQQDAVFLMGRPEFRRWLLTTLRNAGIFTSAYGSASDTLAAFEGSRSLGLNILRDIARAAPVDDPEQQLSFTLLQLFREEAQPQEEPNGRRNRNHDRNDRDRSGDADGSDDGDDFERR